MYSLATKGIISQKAIPINDVLSDAVQKDQAVAQMVLEVMFLLQHLCRQQIFMGGHDH